MKTILKLFLLTLYVHLYESENCESEKMKKLFEWPPGDLKFVWRRQEMMTDWLQTKKYIPENNVPTGLAVHPLENKMFFAINRWKKGVASTLNWSPVGTGNLREPLRPYPNWEVNDIYSNNSSPYKIISVIRVFVDRCNRLWVVDNGYNNKCGGRIQLETPKILVFDTKTNTLIHRHIFDSSIISSKSSFGKIIVDVTPQNCDKAFAYMTDVRSPGILVYDYQRDRAFRIEHSYLEKEPLKSHFYVNGERQESKNHIDGICLSGLNEDGYRNLYVSAQTSNKQFVTSTKYLQNEKYKNNPHIFNYIGERCRNCQSGGAQVLHKSGVMFYSELMNSAISCWNGDLKNFGPETQDRLFVSPQVKYVSDMVLTHDDDELAVISCDLRNFFFTDKGVTVRVLVANVDSLVKGTVCQQIFCCRSKQCM